MSSHLLVTGGAGYIGSHTLIALVRAGYNPVVLDNFSNSSPEALARVALITGVEIECVSGDVRDRLLLDAIFAKYREEGTPIECVLHLAASKAVGESVALPLSYYDNNVAGTICLLEAMRDAGVVNFVFSSSATIYGEPLKLPFTEDHRVAPTNPYGWSKAVVEQILRDLCHSDSTFSAICLRYFNPVGAHESGLIGEDPAGEPNNLFPYITQVAIGARAWLNIFGADYPTVDGSGVRDYLHVSDLAQGHVKAIEYAGISQNRGFIATNLGTGLGTSVLEVVKAFERVNGVEIPCKWSDRRPGDVAEAWADPSMAEQLLGWKAEHGIDRMCEDGWRWQRANPTGYKTHN